MTIADMFNSPSELKFEGKTYHLRQPTLEEEGEYQRWLEQRAYDAIERRTYQDQAQQDRDRNALNRDVAAGLYEWGGVICCESLSTPVGVARMTAIVLRGQGVTPALAKRIVDLKVREVTAAVVSKVRSDPKSMAVILETLGLPPDYLSGISSSGSPTPPSTDQSPNSPASATTS